MFLVHTTRLSKIFAAGRTHPFGNARQRQASKLVSATNAQNCACAAQKMKTFEKEPTRKAVFRSGGGPPGVLLPFLTRGSNPLYHTAGRASNPARHPQLDPQIRRLPQNIRTVTDTQALFATIFVPERTLSPQADHNCHIINKLII